MNSDNARFYGHPSKGMLDSGMAGRANITREVEQKLAAAQQCDQAKANYYPKPEIEAEIPELISRIENQGQIFHERLSSLELRLESVLRAPYPTDVKCEERDCPTTVTGAPTQRERNSRQRDHADRVPHEPPRQLNAQPSRVDPQLASPATRRGSGLKTYGNKENQ